MLKVIGGSTFDLQPVFETIVTTAARLCDAGYAIITTRDGDGYRGVAVYSSAAGETYEPGSRFYPVTRQSLAGRTALEKQVVHIADIDADPDFIPSDAARRVRTRTALGVPMMREGSVVGTLSLGRDRVQPFTDRQTDLVRPFADQAAIAMENARLIEEQREALEQQTATAEVLGFINASPGNLAPVFDAILEKAHNLCGVTKGAPPSSGSSPRPAPLHGTRAAARRKLVRLYHSKLPRHPDGQTGMCESQSTQGRRHRSASAR